MQQQPHKRHLYALTRRQREVWDGIARGNSNLEIAQGLGLAYKTVRVHATHLFATLGTNNRVKVALLWHGVAT